AEDSSTGTASSISSSYTAFTWPASSTVSPCTSVTRPSTTVTAPGSTSSSAVSASPRWTVPSSGLTRYSPHCPSLGEPEVATVIAYRGESGDCCTELATIEPIACSFVPRVPSPELVNDYPIVSTMGRIRNTESKKVPGTRYLPGKNR